MDRILLVEDDWNIVEALSEYPAQEGFSVTSADGQLRTTLTSLTLVASLLAQPELTDERRLAPAWDMRRTLSRLNWLVSSMLMISKRPAAYTSAWGLAGKLALRCRGRRPASRRSASLRLYPRRCSFP